MILGNEDIHKAIKEDELRINPLTEATIREAGVDLRIGPNAKYLKQLSEPIDLHPEWKLPDELYYDIKDFKATHLDPHQFILLQTKEEIRLSNSLMAFCNLRSTYARLGLIIPPTIVDPGYKGRLTIEVYNATRNPIFLHSDERFLHMIIAKLNTKTLRGYRGKYQGHQEVHQAISDKKSTY